MVRAALLRHTRQSDALYKRRDTLCREYDIRLGLCLGIPSQRLPHTKSAMDLRLPRDVLYEIFSHVQDKKTIDHALKVVPDIVYKVVTHIHSPHVVEVPLEYLTSFPRLERTTNILVRVKPQEVDTLWPLSHLRSLCVEILDPKMDKYRLQWLVDLFGVVDKRDDQLFVFNVTDGFRNYNICYHNSHCMSMDDLWRPYAGFTIDYTYDLHPRPYYDFLQGLLPYVEEDTARVLGIMLKYRRYIYAEEEKDLLYPIERQVGKERFRDLVDRYMRNFIVAAGYSVEPNPVEAVLDSVSTGRLLPWRLLHYYDIPDRPYPFTREELDIIQDTTIADRPEEPVAT